MEEASEGDKLHSILYQIHSKLQNPSPSKKAEEVEEWSFSINFLLTNFIRLLEEFVSPIGEETKESSKLSSLLNWNAFWMIRAYDVLEYLENPVLKEIIEKKTRTELTDKLMQLWRYVTQECHSRCLVQNDIDVEVKDGGIIYTFEDGTMAGYNQFILNNSHIISENPCDLLLFKNISKIHSKATKQIKSWLDGELEARYTVDTKDISDSKEESEEEDHSTFPWKGKELLNIDLIFEKVYFPLLITYGVPNSGESTKSKSTTNEKNKIKGFRIQLKIT